MNHSLYDTSSIVDSLRKKLEPFHLYCQHHPVHAVNRDRNIHIGYHKTYDSIKIFKETGFDIQIGMDKELCDILHFSISKEKRRQGYGTQLYNIIEPFCIEELNCRKFVTFASGESAKSFWEKMGFNYIDKERFKAEKIIL